MEQFRAWAVTHPGTVRDHNEDAYVNRPDLGLWAVADGAGGHDAGEVASGLIATALDSIPPELSAEETLTQVRMRMAATHAALRERAARQGHGVIASTVCATRNSSSRSREPVTRESVPRHRWWAALGIESRMRVTAWMSLATNSSTPGLRTFTTTSRPSYRAR